MTEWFEEWFGEEYLQLYPHRDETEADRIVELIVRTVPVEAPAVVLDVACGAGRHARAFKQRGYRPIGLDLSWHLLLRARECARVPLVRSDIRAMPIRPGSVDLAVNLFTSFGYFASDEEHRDALGQMTGTVRRGGWFVLDFLNAARVARELVAAEAVTLGSVRVQVDRWLEDDGRYVYKSITAPDRRQFIERVRLFDESDLTLMLEQSGCVIRHRFGSYQGDPTGPDAPRVILMGERE
ncbi:MAG: class I SAM-dependent methyltransferase [Gemmatimonadota bacterium]